jgi:hypothetical protein
MIQPELPVFDRRTEVKDIATIASSVSDRKKIGARIPGVLLNLKHSDRITRQRYLGYCSSVLSKCKVVSTSL